MTSIGLEICESGNYEKAEQNAVELSAKILKEYGWGIEQLKRHYDWSGKICPRLMYDGDAENKWEEWDRFKSRVAALLDPPISEPEPEAPEVSDQVGLVVNAKRLEEKGTLKNGVTTGPLRPVVEAMGAKISFDDGTRTVYINTTF